MPRFTAVGRLAVLVTLALAPPFALAREVTAGTLAVEHPWARATPVGAAVGGGYLTIVNKGSAPDRLVGGTFEAAAAFELHAMSMEGGVMRMRPIGPLEIPAGTSVTLAPSGKHIMFTGLKRTLKKGETVAGTLVFEQAGTVPVQFEVEGIGARGPGQDPAPGQTGHDRPGLDMN